MKHLLLTIAAVVLVGCGVPSVDIWEAAKAGNIESVKKYLDAGGDVDAKDKYEWTGLSWAAAEGQNEIVELLIANGADVDAQLVGGMTPLIWAKNVNQKETVDLLRKHGGKTAEELKAEGK